MRGRRAFKSGDVSFFDLGDGDMVIFALLAVV